MSHPQFEAVREEKISLLEQQNADIEKTISAQERYLDVLRPQSGGRSIR
jgi:hypothetical protein